MFCLFVVTPATFIFWDRSVPFENLHTFASPAIAHPGEKVNIVVTLMNVTRNCQGYVDRLIVDARGNIFYQGKFPLVYQYGSTPDRHFIKTVDVPTKAEGVAVGPALYRSIPTFWCNPVQRLWPIQGKPMEVAFTIVPNGIDVPEVLAAPSRLGDDPPGGH